MKDAINKSLALEKGKLLIGSTKIIEKLAQNEAADIDEDIEGEEESAGYTELKDLVLEARGLVNSDYWKLLKL